MFFLWSLCKLGCVKLWGVVVAVCLFVCRSGFVVGNFLVSLCWGVSMLDGVFKEIQLGTKLELHPIGYRSSDRFSDHWSKLGDYVTFEWS